MGTSLKGKLTQEFYHDSSVIFEDLEKALNTLEGKGDKTSSVTEGSLAIVHRIFRNIHSLKSEASYLGFDSITRRANDLETLLEAVRNGSKEITPEIIETVRLKTFELKSDLEGNGIEREGEEGSSEKDAIYSINYQGTSKGALSDLNDFELKLLDEARDRGDKFYRMFCEIDEAESMKYPRIYLLINNLELLVNVIKIIPSLDEIKEKGVDAVSIFFTSNVGEKEVFEAVNIDQIKRVTISTLEYNGVFTTEDRYPEISPEQHRLPYTRVDISKLDDMSGYVDEMQFSLHRLHKSFDKFMNINTQEEMKVLSGIASGMQKTLKDLRMVPLSREFKRLEKLTSDICLKLGKQVRFTSVGGEIELDRRLIDLLSDPLKHLIRNALDHGIEHTEDRERLGKGKEGSVLVSAFTNKDRVVIQVSDDGKGMDLAKVKTRGSELGYSSVPEGDLLSYISQPGFSMSEGRSDFSGRGVGLDLVVQKFKEIKGSEFTLVSKPGEGAMFTLSIPHGYSLLKLLIVRVGNMNIALPKRSIDGVEPVKSELFHGSVEGFLVYEDLPVYTVQGRMLSKDKKPGESFMIRFRYLGKKGVLLVDELLFENEIPEDQLYLGEELSPHLFTVTMNHRKMEYYFLNPSIIK